MHLRHSTRGVDTVHAERPDGAAIVLLIVIEDHFLEGDPGLFLDVLEVGRLLRLEDLLDVHGLHVWFTGMQAAVSLSARSSNLVRPVRPACSHAPKDASVGPDNKHAVDGLLSRLQMRKRRRLGQDKGYFV